MKRTSSARRLLEKGLSSTSLTGPPLGIVAYHLQVSTLDFVGCLGFRELLDPA
jgi:hypothetical protein